MCADRRCVSEREKSCRQDWPYIDHGLYNLCMDDRYHRCGNTMDRLDEALAEYKKRIAAV